jgi:hypothetical protein
MSEGQDQGELFKRGRFVEAANLTDALAANEKPSDGTGNWQRLMMQSAIAWYEAGAYEHAAARLMRLSSVKADVSQTIERCIRLLSAKSAISANFNIDIVEEFLDEVRVADRSFRPNVRRPYLLLMSEYKMATGDWQAAFELAGAAKVLTMEESNDDDYLGLFACDARVLQHYVRSSLLASKLDEAADALQEFEAKGCVQTGCCGPRLLFAQIEAAFATNDINSINFFTKQFLAAADARSSYELDIWALDRRVRCLLLDAELGDPLCWSHPAMALLRSTRRASRHLNEKFRISMLLLDFRIASLRFSAGLHPASDLYRERGYNGDSVPSERLFVDLGSAIDRARRARITAGLTMRNAAQLDSQWNSDWRGAMVRQRFDRISEIEKILSRLRVVDGRSPI